MEGGILGVGGDWVHSGICALNNYLAAMIKDNTFAIMRTQGTKYESRDTLPSDALPVSVFYRKYGKRFNVSSPAYAYVKYDRHKFGYTSNAGTKLIAANPGYEIIDYYGTCYVINYQ